ncbi:MAG TPA: universal stress protein [Vicinamibacterales bacterium]|nr:universal stress protein [Vicinamibacterales bacterium]
MSRFRRLLVATDFSEPSRLAMSYACELADTFEAALHVLHVVSDPYAQPWASEAFGVPLADVLADWERAARQQLEQAVPPEIRQRREVRLVTRVGQPFFEIIDYAEKERIDLIVMGTHGRGFVAHMLMGSVAEKVVRKAPCPVLIVRSPRHAGEG